MLLDHLSSTWQNCIQPNSTLRKILISQGLSRDPLLSEILVYSVVEILRDSQLAQRNWQSRDRTISPNEHFRVGREYAVIPLTDRLYDLVLTRSDAERDGELSHSTVFERNLRRLHIHSIRTTITNKATTPLHSVLTQLFSNYHSRDLLTFTNKIGSSFSHSKECEDTIEAKKTLWITIELKYWKVSPQTAISGQLIIWKQPWVGAICWSQMKNLHISWLQWLNTSQNCISKHKISFRNLKLVN